MPDCAYCAALTLRELYKNAQEHEDCSIQELFIDSPDVYEHWRFDFKFPQTAYFRHQQSWEALEESAGDGCELCSVIYDEFMNSFDYLRKSIQEKLEKALPTDIRISLGSSFKEHGVSPRLDVLIVQLGHYNLQYDYDDDLSVNNIESRIAFHLNRPKEVSETICALDIGRPKLDANLGSEQFVNIARSWLHQCTSWHCPSSAPGYPKRRCEAPERTKLPTRILDLGSDVEPVVKLLVTNNHCDYYTTLSHCWGGGSSLKLTQESLHIFIQAIPMEKVPRNFLDAISITRSLGFRYLWIDSLCIVQDSPLDWELESAKMGDIYRNAVLTISASASANTTIGILHTYRPANSTTLKHRLRLKLDQEDVGEVYLDRRVPHEERFRDCFGDLPLACRGWALQEQILSRRNLYYGKRAIYWTCRSSHQSADGAPAGDYLAAAIPNMIPALFTMSNTLGTPDHRTIYFNWLLIVETYQLRELTREVDKLPAISGLAREVHQLTGGTYLAGIWLADLVNGMLWCQVTPEFKPNTIYRGPSWSWVGINGKISFLTRNETRVPSSHDAAVLHVEAIAAGQNPFGAVTSGFAKLKGLTLEIEQSKDQYYYPDRSKSLGVVDYFWRDKGQSPSFMPLDIHTQYWHDRQRSQKDVQFPDFSDDDSNVETQQCLALYLGIWADDKEGALGFIDLEDTGSREVECRHNAYALLLRPSASTNEKSFERVGVLEFDGLQSSLFKGNTWKPQVLTII
ncbi:hypothetical protein H2200_004561 [Cladophialophora chaetospira]|uniref:Heterokaryon incompatibility domain-containing protein n=1 Tax=Cladophialophora chaetospira TaxID=386627 RepID=A0AA38XE43_9EURO|nr:hypothetical protein H2200_004561 [Cladophialophora chaetospira]